MEHVPSILYLKPFDYKTSMPPRVPCANSVCSIKSSFQFAVQWHAQLECLATHSGSRMRRLAQIKNKTKTKALSTRWDGFFGQH